MRGGESRRAAATADSSAFGVDQSKPTPPVVHFALNAARAAFITLHTCWLLVGAREERQQLALTRPWLLSD